MRTLGEFFIWCALAELAIAPLAQKQTAHTIFDAVFVIGCVTCWALTRIVGGDKD